MKKTPTLRTASDKTFICLPQGQTKCILTKVEFKDFPSFENPEVMEEKVLMQFQPAEMELAPDEKCMISRKFTFSGHEKAKLREIVSMMQTGIPESLWNDEQKYWDLVKGFEGKEFLVIHKPDKTGKYNNLVSAISLNSPSTTKRPKLAEPKEKTLEDQLDGGTMDLTDKEIDDVPF